MKINFNKKSGGLKIKTFAAILLASFVFTACGSESSSDCLTSLDNREFAAVSDNTSCSDYHRASAYLGRAGFLFENFLAANASANYRHALGIPDSATVFSTWEGKTYYDAAIALTENPTLKSNGKLTDEGKQLTEIHFFTSLAALMAQNYITLDQDANGTISEAEKNSFSKVNSTTASDYGTNDISVESQVQVTLANGDIALINLATAKCYNDTSTAAGTYFLDGGTGFDLTDTTRANCPLVNAGTTSGSCNLIFKVNSISKMFTETISADGGSITGLTGGFLTGVTNMNTDLTLLGVPADSDLTKGLNDFKTKLDNGGTCTTDTVTGVNKLLSLIAVSQKDALTTTYASVNTIALTTLAGASDSTTTAPTTTGITCTNADALDTRLVFKHPDGLYYPYYAPATSPTSSATYTTFLSLTNIQKDSTGTAIPDTKGDSKVSFRELLCMQ